MNPHRTLSYNQSSPAARRAPSDTASEGSRKENMRKLQTSDIFGSAFALVLLILFGLFFRTVYRHEQQRDLEKACDLLSTKHSILSGIEPAYISDVFVEGECFIFENPRYSRDPFKKTDLVRVPVADIEDAWAGRKK